MWLQCRNVAENWQYGSRRDVLWQIVSEFTAVVISCVDAIGLTFSRVNPLNPATCRCWRSCLWTAFLVCCQNKSGARTTFAITTFSVPRHQATPSKLIGHVLRHDCLLKTVLGGRWKGNGQDKNQEGRCWIYLWSKRTRRSVATYEELTRGAQSWVGWRHRHWNLP